MRFHTSLLLAAASLALTACVAPNTGLGPDMPKPIQIPAVPGQDNAARSDARVAINREMARRLPGANVAPYTDCVISNATSAEVASIGLTSRQGGNVSDTVAAVVSRPGTSQCIANAAADARRGTI